LEVQRNRARDLVDWAVPKGNASEIKATIDAQHGEIDRLREMAAAYARECAALGSANVHLTAENTRLRAVLHEIERRTDFTKSGE
jgi:N-methylhydantoinase B/oxoprolinase/acetone carboxylase alpha subunit